MALQIPHRFYKRYQENIDNSFIAVAFGLLVAAVLGSLPVYPANWVPVLVISVIFLGFRWHWAAYTLAVFIIAYPLYTVSLYVAILFIAFAVLLQRPLSHYMGAAVLILATPWLAKYNLHWVVPLLLGLWWGAINGFWLASLAALWGKMLGGMSGLDIDWLSLAGLSPQITGIIQRFHGLGATETLLKIIEPFSPNSTLLLYHLLQIILWASVAAIMGVISDRAWLHHRFYPWFSIINVALGISAMMAGHFALTLWLTGAAPSIFPWESLITAGILSLVLVGSLDLGRRFLDLPLKPSQKKSHKSTFDDMRQGAGRWQRGKRTRHTSMPVPDLPDWEPSQEKNDLILLELD